MSRPFAVHDLPPEAFPLTIEAFGPEGDLVWERTVERPDPRVRRVVDVPGTGPGSVARIRVTSSGSGETHEYNYEEGE